MADVAPCTQYDNYGPRRLHVTGRKVNPYDWTLKGVVRANGQTYVGDGAAEQPAPMPAAVATPGCRSCFGGCS